MTGVLLLAALAWGGPFRPAPPQRVQAPAFTVAADPANGHRPTVSVAGVLGDDALEQAARSGLPLRLRFRTELWRDRFFDELVAQESWSTVLLHEPLQGNFSVLTQADPPTNHTFESFDDARLAVETDYPLALRPDRAGRYYYVAVLEIETLSLSDFEELETWLRGELRPAVAGERSLTGAIGQGLKRVAIRILGMPSRRFEARSERFQIS